MNPATVADRATMRAFLNCYARETGDAAAVPADETPVATDADRVLHLPLSSQGVDVYAPLSHESATGRHLFDGYHYRAGGETLPLDAATLAALCAKELSLDRDGAPGELLHRVLLSKRNVERFVAARGDADLTDPDATFAAAEQSLPFGHLTHPTPKSRQGMGDDADDLAPELGASFRLRYAHVDPSLVADRSALDRSAAEWVRRDLRAAGEPVPDDAVPIPLHPRQAEVLRDDPGVRALVEAGDLSFAGPAGREWYPTASVRTLYSPDAPFMVKASLPVHITNSLRTNGREELARGVAVAELLDAGLAAELDDRYPGFEIVRDPAALAVDVGEGESGFETVLRANPFPGDPRGVTPVVGLCQDAVAGPEESRLGRLIRRIADREGRSTAAVSADWFERYLARSLRPALWLYLERGLGVEAHQQNTVLELGDDGYPDAVYYRDNQGYYLPESRRDRVEALLPDAADRMGTLCPDAVADERLRYYLVLNNAVGVVNAFGCAGLCEERDLLALLRDELEACRRFDAPESTLLDDLLSEPTVPCKANLLTRFHDMDELVGSLENQSVYADVPNPLVAELEVAR